MIWLTTCLLVSAAAVFAIVAGNQEEKCAVEYLNQYHYISPSRSGNHDMQTAIRTFQTLFRLPVTGKLDGRTIQEMRKPRCGRPDVETGEDNQRMKRFLFSNTRKWQTHALKWYLSPGKDLAADIQAREFKHAFQYWANVTPLRFTQVTNPRDANLKISFGTFFHRGPAEDACFMPSDFPGGVLAHAYFPQDGRLHFDEAETWTVGTNRGTNLGWVVTHEIGHALGLDHLWVGGTIMFPTYSGYDPNMKLHPDDIKRIQNLYGKGFCRDKWLTCFIKAPLCGFSGIVRQNCPKICRQC